MPTTVMQGTLRGYSVLSGRSSAVVEDTHQSPPGRAMPGRLNILGEFLPWSNMTAPETCGSSILPSGDRQDGAVISSLDTNLTRGNPTRSASR